MIQQVIEMRFRNYLNIFYKQKKTNEVLLDSTNLGLNLFKIPAVVTLLSAVVQISKTFVWFISRKELLLTCSVQGIPEYTLKKGTLQEALFFLHVNLYYVLDTNFEPS